MLSRVFEAFLQRRADNPRLEDWQVRQCVDAIQLLLEDLANAPVSDEIDWDAWRHGSQLLNADHATLARDQAVVKTVARAATKPGVMEQRRVLEQLVIEIRARHYSIRTEKTYLNWAIRFFKFCKSDQENTMGAGQVQLFLQYLAIERKVSASTQNQEAGQQPCAQALFRDTFTRVRLRYSHGSGIARAHRCIHNHDLHPRTKSSRCHRCESS